MRLAIHESMAESQEHFEAIQASRARLAERLRPMNLERLDTEADGNCQFIALAWSAEAPIDHATLRLQIVQYLQSMESLFSGWFDRHWQDYQSYLQHMLKDGSYGDELTLQAASHLFLRPIKVISGDTEESESVRVFCPPECVSRDLWGPEIVVGYLAWNHFEATGPLQECSR